MTCGPVVLVGKMPTKAVTAVHCAARRGNHQHPAPIFLYECGRAFKPKLGVGLAQRVDDKAEAFVLLLPQRQYLPQQRVRRVGWVHARGKGGGYQHGEVGLKIRRQRISG